jgi:hypothetical protein
MQTADRHLVEQVHCTKTILSDPRLPNIGALASHNRPKSQLVWYHQLACHPLPLHAINERQRPSRCWVRCQCQYSVQRLSYGAHNTTQGFTRASTGTHSRRARACTLWHAIPHDVQACKQHSQQSLDPSVQTAWHCTATCQAAGLWTPAQGSARTAAPSTHRGLLSRSTAAAAAAHTTPQKTHTCSHMATCAHQDTTITRVHTAKFALPCQRLTHHACVLDYCMMAKLVSSASSNRSPGEVADHSALPSSGKSDAQQNFYTSNKTWITTSRKQTPRPLTALKAIHTQ